MRKSEIKLEVERVFNELSNKHKITLEEREYNIWKYIMDKTNNEANARRQVMGTNEYVSLFFEDYGPMGQANYRHNTVYINVNRLQEYIDSDFQTCYKKEYKFIQRNVLTEKEAIKWLVCHEFAHTLRLDKVDHTNNFFQTVENLFNTIK